MDKDTKARLRTLAYAMESMSLTERLDSLYQLVVESQSQLLQEVLDDKPLTTMDLVLNLYVERIEKRNQELQSQLSSIGESK